MADDFVVYDPLAGTTDDDWYDIQPRNIENTIYVTKKPQNMMYTADAIFAECKKWFLAFFDDDYFKMVRTVSEFPSTKDFKNMMMNIPKMPTKPMCIFDMSEIAYVESDSINDLIQSTRKIEHDGLSLGNSIPCTIFSKFIDSDVNLSDDDIMGINYSTKRYKTSIDILMVVSGISAHRDLYDHLVDTIRFKSKFTLTRTMPVKIDKAFIVNMAKVMGVEADSDEFLDMMNQYSSFPVTRVDYFKDRSDIFYLMPLDLLFELDSLPSSDDPSKDGMLEEALRTRVRFSVETSFPNALNFVVSKVLMQDPILDVSENPTAVLTYELPLLELPRVKDGYTAMDVISAVMIDIDDNSLPLYDIFPKGLTHVDTIYDKIVDLDSLKKYSFVDVFEDNVSYKDITYDMDGLTINKPSIGKSYTIVLYLNLPKNATDIIDDSLLRVGNVVFSRV